MIAADSSVRYIPPYVYIRTCPWTFARMYSAVGRNRRFLLDGRAVITIAREYGATPNVIIRDRTHGFALNKYFRAREILFLFRSRLSISKLRVDV